MVGGDLTFAWLPFARASSLQPRDPRVHLKGGKRTQRSSSPSPICAWRAPGPGETECCAGAVAPSSLLPTCLASRCQRALRVSRGAHEARSGGGWLSADGGVASTALTPPPVSRCDDRQVVREWPVALFARASVPRQGHMYNAIGKQSRGGAGGRSWLTCAARPASRTASPERIGRCQSTLRHACAKMRGRRGWEDASQS